MKSAPVTEADRNTVDQVRLANRQLNPQRKAELGQFMTPAGVANFMASLFSVSDGAVRLLDAGAGVGSLTDAFVRRWSSHGVSATAYEIDKTLIDRLQDTLRRFGNGSFEATIIDRDFIQDAVYRITLGNKGQGFTHAILNPPYKKISSDSIHRALLRAAGLETVKPLHRFRWPNHSAYGHWWRDRSDHPAQLLQRSLL